MVLIASQNARPELDLFDRAECDGGGQFENRVRVSVTNSEGHFSAAALHIVFDSPGSDLASLLPRH
jgi:hypothetical protein